MIACLRHSRNGQLRRGGLRFANPPLRSYQAETVAALSLLFVPYALLAFAQTLRNCRSSWYQRGLIREPLREIGVILLHDVEHRFLGELAMVLGKKSVQVSELFVIHGHRTSAAMPNIWRPVDPAPARGAPNPGKPGGGRTAQPRYLKCAAPAR